MSMNTLLYHLHPPLHQSENSVSLGGIMTTILISRNGSIHPGWYVEFFMIPGLSALSIVFEGVDKCYLFFSIPKYLTERAIRGEIIKTCGPLVDQHAMIEDGDKELKFDDNIKYRLESYQLQFDMSYLVCVSYLVDSINSFTNRCRTADDCREVVLFIYNILNSHPMSCTIIHIRLCLLRSTLAGSMLNCPMIVDIDPSFLSQEAHNHLKDPREDNFSALLWDLETLDDPSIIYGYNRFSEIEENRESILSLASELRPHDDRGNRIKNELSFLNGDWDQQSVGAPLMPFDDSDLQRNDQGGHSFVKLVSFWVMDVDPVHQSKNAISVSGIMNISITRDNSFTYKPYEWSPKFKTVPGSSTITILFEGVYIEYSTENRGERLMCLIGNATKPTRNQIDSLELMDEYAFSLTTRGICGEMLGEHSKYQFGAEELLKACSPYPYQGNMVDKDIQMFAGNDFCDMLQNFVINHIFDFVPNSESFNADNNGSHLGPLLLGKEIKSTIGCFDNFKLVIQQMRCEPGIHRNNVRNSKVFAVFRLFHYYSWKDRHLPEERTGLSGTTISAEGIWRSSEGQLCMIGCLGFESASAVECNTRICLYFPCTISFKQQSIMFGTISSTNGSHISLLFEKHPSFSRSDLANLSHLADELSFQMHSTLNLISSDQAHKTKVEIQVLSIGSLFGEYWYQHRTNIEQRVEDQLSASDSDIIEISGQLTITSQQYSNISLVFEGIIFQRSQKWERTLKEEWIVSLNFEVSVEYPPENARWLINPRVKISFSSKRSEEDPLHLPYSKNTVSCSEVFLVMLAIQALGYCIPLITGNEILFRWKVVLESCIKQKVRIRREKKVFLITVIVHLMGFLLTQISMTSASETLPIAKKYSYMKGNTERLLEWLVEMDDYAGLVQDFLLLPQIINNTLRRVEVLHAYGYVRDPLPDKGYSYSEHHNLSTSSGLYSEVRNITTAIIVIVLAIILHIQNQNQYDSRNT
ncbi:uncharacterized protein LOC111284424 [Durio zibethinus]|uniref:RING-type E3 ubiquitin transferase n=1 Tax=Durio zibethinus TaxID=66656 RepID=A0A6P5XL08_DURZI|nr:uncharacterized protein LOC111284424 [Durio zibethinus]